MMNEINSSENLFEIVNNEQEISATNYNELLQKFANIMKEINAKIHIGKQNSQSNTEDGIFKDLENNL